MAKTTPEVLRAILLADGRYLLRINDANTPFPAEQIAALARNSKFTVPDELEHLLSILKEKETIQNEDVCKIFGINRKTASRLLTRLVAEGWLTRAGERRGTRYSLAHLL